MADHEIFTRLHITDIETREVYAVQASCACGWLGHVRYLDEVSGDISRLAADLRAEIDGEDHLAQRRGGPGTSHWPQDNPATRRRQ